MLVVSERERERERKRERERGRERQRETETEKERERQRQRERQRETERDRERELVYIMGSVDSFPFSVVRMPDKSSNVPSSIVYSANGAESLRIARASNILESFSTAIKALIARMSRQGISIGK